MGTPGAPQQIGNRSDGVRLGARQRPRSAQCGRPCGGEGGRLEGVITEDALVDDVVPLSEELGLVSRVGEERRLGSRSGRISTRARWDYSKSGVVQYFSKCFCMAL